MAWKKKISLRHFWRPSAAAVRRSGPGNLRNAWAIALPSGLKVIEVPCSGSISFDHLFAAFKNNADGVLVLTCHEGNCHSERGNSYARQTVDEITDRFSKIGFEKERILMQTLASNMGN